jgi:hypothetical protein
VRYKKFVDLSYYDDHQAVLSERRTRRSGGPSSRVFVEDQSDRMYESGGKFSSAVVASHRFRAVRRRRTGRNEHDETSSGVSSTGYFAIAIVGLMLDDRRGAML